MATVNPTYGSGLGGYQIINGKSYKMNTPAWYAAQQAEAQRSTTAAGQAAGSALNAFQTAANPSNLASRTSTSSGSGSGGSGLPSYSPAPVSSYSGGAGGAASAGGGAGGGGALAREPNPADALNRTTQQNLLRAKERQGQIAQSSLTGLREALGARQMLGSGAEAQATGDVASSAAQSLTDINRQGLIQEDEQARQLAALSYSGGITQRGQDIGLMGQNQRAGLEARGQDINAALGQRGQDVSMRGQDINERLAQMGFSQSSYQQLNAILDALRGQAY